MTLEPMLLTLDQCSQVTTVSRSELYRAVRAGRLEARVIAGRKRVTPAALRAFIRGEASR